VGPDGWIYAFGGFTSQPVDTVEAYDPVGNVWHSATPLPHPSAGLTAATGPDGTMYVGAGFDGQNELNTVYAVHKAASNATPLASHRPSKQEGAFEVLAYLAIGALLLGGWKLVKILEWYLPPPLDEIVDFIAEMFDSLTFGAFSGGPSNRLAPAQVSSPVKSLLIAIGGSQGGTATKGVQVVNPKTGVWTPAVPLPGGREDAVVAEGPDGTIYVIGGDDNSGYTFDTVFALHPPAPSTPTPTATPRVTNTPVASNTPAPTSTPTATPLPPTDAPVPTAVPSKTKTAKACPKNASKKKGKCVCKKGYKLSRGKCVKVKKH
jgi:hypothetical protein